jgi:hypothetical protein
MRQVINTRQDVKMAPERNAKRLARYRKYVERKLHPKERKKPSQWVWELFGESGTLESFTRSEARALLKERFNLKRVPQEAKLEKVCLSK